MVPARLNPASRRALCEALRAARRHPRRSVSATRHRRAIYDSTNPRPSRCSLLRGARSNPVSRSPTAATQASLQNALMTRRQFMWAQRYVWVTWHSFPLVPYMAGSNPRLACFACRAATPADATRRPRRVYRSGHWVRRASSARRRASTSSWPATSPPSSSPSPCTSPYSPSTSGWWRRRLPAASLQSQRAWEEAPSSSACARLSRLLACPADGARRISQERDDRREGAADRGRRRIYALATAEGRGHTAADYTAHGEGRN